MSLRKSTLKGLYWNSISQYGSQIIGIVITMVLARLITPSQFGIIAMITVFSNFSGILIDFGFKSSIIQKKDVTTNDLSSIFWLNLIVGLFLSIIFFISAPLIANIYNEPQLVPLIKFISISFTITAISLVPTALFLKSMDFKSLAIRNLLAAAISGGTGIVLAYIGFGEWALAIQLVLQGFLSTILIWTLTDWRPSFILKWSSILRYTKLSSALFINSSITYFSSNIDNFLIGKMYNQKSLGIYSKSYAIIKLPTTNISKVLSAVFLPSFSKIQDDPAKIKKYYVKIIKIVISISFPLMIMVYFYAKEFVLIVFGDQWIEAVPFIKIFSISGMIASINSLLGSVIISRGRTDLIFKEIYLKRPSVIIGILVGAYISVFAIAIGKLLADIFNLFVTFFQIKDSIGLSIMGQLRSMLYISFSNMILIFTIILIKPEFHQINMPTIISLTIPLIIYGIVLYLGEKKLIQEVIKTFNSNK